ncbi:hypothetical protein [Terriglobus sp. TAA 43]|uniref:hypothetical protein n=1 Tax=Terriglobus sp. TAA 43 TaxID=278961 RepID=UPI0006466341|nr:hypothetical protein [Terriglobus sp. TAA 43]
MKLHLLSASVLLAALPVLAQGPAGPGAHPFAPGGPGPMGFGFGHQPVTNAPYSATFTTTATEKLQDGTTLTHTATRTVSRDSLGRTREEVTFPAHGTDTQPHTMITIFDPVAKTITTLRTEKKIAVVRAIPEPRGAGRRGPGGPPPAGDNAQAQPEGAPHRGPREDKNVATTDLGSKTIAGVVATGKRITRTIPANTMGNTAPIVTTHEEWFSQDLKVELSRSDVNPFRGSDTMTVSGLTKAEPVATLFQVPTGYTVQAAQDHGFGRRGFGGPEGQRRGGDNPPPPPPAGM